MVGVFHLIHVYAIMDIMAHNVNSTIVSKCNSTIQMCVMDMDNVHNQILVNVQMVTLHPIAPFQFVMAITHLIFQMFVPLTVIVWHQIHARVPMNTQEAYVKSQFAIPFQQMKLLFVMGMVTVHYLTNANVKKAILLEIAQFQSVSD